MPRPAPKLAVAAASLAAVAFAAGLVVANATDDPANQPPAAGTPADAVVQVWFRRSLRAANVGGCRSTGVPDAVTDGEIWTCRLWYLDPAEAVTVCVAMEERVVERRVRRELPDGTECR